MSEFYAEMIDTAAELFEEFKQGTAFLVTRETTVPAGRPWDESPSGTTHRFELEGSITRSFQERWARGEREITGTDNSMTEVQMALSPFARDESGARVGIEPAFDDRIELDGSLRRISEIKRIPEAGDVIVYKIILGS